MSARTKKRISRARLGFSREGWRARVHPAFAGYWKSLKKNWALAKIKDQKESESKLQEWAGEFSVASRALDEAIDGIRSPIGPKIQSAILKRLDIEGPVFVPPSIPGQEATFYPENPESSPIFRKLVFLKYGITFRDLIWKIDIENNSQAHRQLMAVHRDFWRYKSKGKDFKDLKDLKLKFHWDHFEIITHGFDFGIEHLTLYELADCLDEICPCGKKHSPEYLKKLRKSIKGMRDRLA
jgi:hypothetical protein